METCHLDIDFQISRMVLYTSYWLEMCELKALQDTDSEGMAYFPTGNF